MTSHAKWMKAAIALADCCRGKSAPRANVGCVLVKDDQVIGRGYTQSNRDIRAETIALQEGGVEARGATLYLTLEPCAGEGPTIASYVSMLVEAGVEAVVVARVHPDPRSAGEAIDQLRRAGISVRVGVGKIAADRAMAGFLTRHELGRPFVTLKMATSLDGKIALESGESRWITGEDARAHVHLQRSRADMILVGRGTYDVDQPKLDVRLPGLEHHSPRRAILSRSQPVDGWTWLQCPDGIYDLENVHDLMIEGGAGAASAFLRVDLVDRMLIYRAPILVGDGKSCIQDIGLRSLPLAHGRWTLQEGYRLGVDQFEVYERTRGSPSL
jgi:diaminohydroxyphosphoribosylaminopyrimidine deaminase/5-amino-6-(5-phosphoribosylamino)uracil reductase